MEQETIYLDNAATSHPRPRAVIDAICDYLSQVGANPGRSGHTRSLKAGRMLLETREMLAEFFERDKPENVIFTQNVTHAINLVLNGYLERENHVITTKYEHNSVLRPLTHLQKNRNINVDYLPVDVEGQIKREDLDHLKTDKTSLLIINHASNVSGTVLDITAADTWAKEHGIPLLVDTAQTAGSLNFDWSQVSPEFLCFTGHKSLLGPSGIGGLIISPEMVEETDSFVRGGTGSKSDQLSQPSVLPDKYEAGTVNITGVAGLNAGLKYLKKTGLAEIKKHKMNLTSHFYKGLNNLSNVNIAGPDLNTARTSTISITFENDDPARISVLLDREHGIMTRSGLHCAPLAHKNLNTYPEGTLRFSIGYFNTEQDINKTLQALKEVTTT